MLLRLKKSWHAPLPLSLYSEEDSDIMMQPSALLVVSTAVLRSTVTVTPRSLFLFQEYGRRHCWPEGLAYEYFSSSVVAYMMA